MPRPPRLLLDAATAISPLLTLVMFLCGCSIGETGVRRGARITHVQLDYGLPDVISDRSGDLERFYLPAARPESEWPAEAPRTFFYLRRNLAITFVSGQAVEAGPIRPDLRHHTLLPLTRGHNTEP